MGVLFSLFPLKKRQIDVKNDGGNNLYIKVGK